MFIVGTVEVQAPHPHDEGLDQMMTPAMTLLEAYVEPAVACQPQSALMLPMQKVPDIKGR